MLLVSNLALFAVNVGNTWSRYGFDVSAVLPSKYPAISQFVNIFRNVTFNNIYSYSTNSMQYCTVYTSKALKMFNRVLRNAALEPPLLPPIALSLC